MNYCWVVLAVTTFIWHVSLSQNETSENIRIGSFNIRTFGPTKAGKPHVLDVISKIVRRYDIILIVEIRDASGGVIPTLLRSVNSQGSYVYDYVISNRLGSGSYQEQYAYVYRKNSVQVKKVMDYQDDDNLFEREPYVVQFQLPSANISSVTLLGLHLKPDNVLQEMEALTGAVDKVKKKLGVEDILIAGDLNCDCDYIRPYQFETVTVRKDPSHVWMIDWCQGRTMVSTWCRYDRMIAVGQSFISNGIVKDSGSVYQFDKAFNLNETEALEISDHFPVEILIKKKDT